MEDPTIKDLQAKLFQEECKTESLTKKLASEKDVTSDLEYQLQEAQDYAKLQESNITNLQRLLTQECKKLDEIYDDLSDREARSAANCERLEKSLPGSRTTVADLNRALHSLTARQEIASQSYEELIQVNKSLEIVTQVYKNRLKASEIARRVISRRPGYEEAFLSIEDATPESVTATARLSTSSTPSNLNSVAQEIPDWSPDSEHDNGPPSILQQTQNTTIMTPPASAGRNRLTDWTTTNPSNPYQSARDHDDDERDIIISTDLSSVPPRSVSPKQLDAKIPQPIIHNTSQQADSTLSSSLAKKPNPNSQLAHPMSKAMMKATSISPTQQPDTVHSAQDPPSACSERNFRSVAPVTPQTSSTIDNSVITGTRSARNPVNTSISNKGEIVLAPSNRQDRIGTLESAKYNTCLETPRPRSTLSDLATEKGRTSTSPEVTVTIEQPITSTADQERSSTLLNARSQLQQHIGVQHNLPYRDLIIISYRKRFNESSPIHQRLTFVASQHLFDEPFTISLKSHWREKSVLNDARWKDLSNTAREITHNISKRISEQKDELQRAINEARRKFGHSFEGNFETTTVSRSQPNNQYESLNLLAKTIYEESKMEGQFYELLFYTTLILMQRANQPEFYQRVQSKEYEGYTKKKWEVYRSLYTVVLRLDDSWEELRFSLLYLLTLLPMTKLLKYFRQTTRPAAIQHLIDRLNNFADGREMVAGLGMKGLTVYQLLKSKAPTIEIPQVELEVRQDKKSIPGDCLLPDLEGNLDNLRRKRKASSSLQSAYEKRCRPTSAPPIIINR